MIYLLFGKIIVWAGGILITLILLGLLTYFLYDVWLKKILDWDSQKARDDLFYFLQNKKRLKEIIDNEKKVKE